MKKISECNKCGLCFNQKPLLDNFKYSDVMWVGLSAKKVESLFDETPLANNTNTGKIIEAIEEKFYGVSFYKTNIVKCLPLDEKQKLRYPTLLEMEACSENLSKEVKNIRPSIVFLLGSKVSDFVFQQHKKNTKSLRKENNSWVYDDTIYFAIQHPSYIHVYKRKFIDDYVAEIQLKIESTLEHILRHAS